MVRQKKPAGKWLPFQILGEPGRYWKFWVAGGRVFARYHYYSANGKILSVGHWLTESEHRLVAALAMNNASKALTSHQIVCTIVRNDMQHWKENATKVRFRKIVRTGA